MSVGAFVDAILAAGSLTLQLMPFLIGMYLAWRQQIARRTTLSTVPVRASTRFEI